MDKLTGKTALVTGALQEIGEGVARALVHHSANLILLDISPEIEKSADELCGRGHCCTAAVADVYDPTSVAAAIKRTKEKEGCINILVNSVGVCRLGNSPDMSNEDRDFHIDINIKSIWSVIEAVLPEMTARGDGRIVVISLATGDMVADPGETVYALTETVTVGLTKSLTVEYAQSGIRINAICPGYIRTPMVKSTACQSNPEDPELVLTGVVKAVPICRLADPLETGELTAFLASDESSYLTGIQNMIDGGNTLPETASVGI